MADAAVQFLLENLTQLLIHQVKLISNAQGEVEQLVENVKFFKSFLMEVSSKRRRKDKTLRALVGEIRGVIYDADDVIDSFVTQAAEKKTKSWFSTKGVSSAAGLLDIARKVSEVRGNIDKIYGGKDKLDLINLATDDAKPNDLQQLMPSRQPNVVGLEDEAETIVGYLKDKTEYMDVISIVGMPGLGKTTLTGKIYHDPDIQYEFPTRIWVPVSHDFNEKEVFLSILKQIKTKLEEGDNNKTQDDLAKDISAHLDGVKFLLVMDDVWEKRDWDRLKVILPEHRVNGKVMITSRQDEVGLHANRIRKPHKLRRLNIDESYELLRQEVFDKAEFPSDLVKVGKDIADKCEGLPLALVVIGGVLTTKISRSVTAWEKVAKSVTTFLHDHDPDQRMDKIIALSYEKLPYHLKECFLYLGMFPEDFEIPAWKLIRMWVAEGLIQVKDDISMEESAELYLDELISRNLVRVERLKADGSVKTCRIHDMLRDFCKREGGIDKDNFFQEVKQSVDGGLFPIVTEGEKYRRLCIHSNVLGFLSKNPKGLCVRSFVTFSEDTRMSNEKISAISGAFKLLRVLEAKPLKFEKIPTDFYHLVHLRYLAFSLKSATLPAAFNKLWNIQTLIVDTTEPTLNIKADIMSMTQLKHLETNASTTLAEPGKGSNGGEKLQTVCTLSTKSCTEAILGKAHNLKKLGIRGKLGLFLNGKTGSIDTLTKLIKLEKLKLVNDMSPDPPSTGKLYGLPPYHKFPPMLRSLTLFTTSLDWTHMSVLALLENLQVLKLKDNAFMGSNWTVSHGGFNSLEFFHIERTDLSIWDASAHHFPNLKRLELHNCEKLKQIPIGLAEIPKFEYLDIQLCRKVASSAIKIATAKKNTVSTFKLSIVPPVDAKY